MPEGTALHEGIFYPRTKKIRGRGGYSVVYSLTTPHIYNKYTTLFFLSFVNNSRTCYITYGSHLTHVQPFICPVSHIYMPSITFNSCATVYMPCQPYICLLMPDICPWLQYICPIPRYICPVHIFALSTHIYALREQVIYVTVGLYTTV